MYWNISNSKKEIKFDKVKNKITISQKIQSQYWKFSLSCHKKATRSSDWAEKGEMELRQKSLAEGKKVWKYAFTLKEINSVDYFTANKQRETSARD